MTIDFSVIELFPILHRSRIEVLRFQAFERLPASYPLQTCQRSRIECLRFRASARFLVRLLPRRACHLSVSFLLPTRFSPLYVRSRYWYRYEYRFRFPRGSRVAADNGSKLSFETRQGSSNRWKRLFSPGERFVSVETLTGNCSFRSRFRK